MKSKIDWPNHLISFVLVVLSILMAFQLERCSSDRREDKLVDAHMAAIQEETRFNLVNIDQVLQKLASDQQQLDTLLQLITRTDDASEVNQRVFRLMNVGGLYLRKNAYASFTESGDVRFMDEFELKTDLIKLYEYYKLADVTSELLVTTFNDGYFGYIQDNLDLYRATPAPIEVYRERKFINAISSYRYFLNTCLQTFRQTKVYMEEFWRPLKAEACLSSNCLPHG